MVRCAADVRSADQSGKEGEIRFKETLCPLKYLQEVWQQFLQKSTGYDTKRPKRYRTANYEDSEFPTITEKYYDCLQCTDQCRHVLLTSESDSTSSATNRDTSATTKLDSSAAKEDSSATKERDNSKGIIKIEYKFASSHAKRIIPRYRSPLTPARKRSSLARPVRVHDSFVQPKRQVMGQKKPYSEAYSSEPDNIWSIRYKLEEMQEMALSRMRKEGKRRRKMTIKRAIQNDTERLLKVLSVNRVDQSYYNVKRCSVMWESLWPSFVENCLGTALSSNL